MPTTVTVFDPTLSAMAPDAAPDATATPFTVTVAVESVTVGDTVIDEVAFGTVAV